MNYDNPPTAKHDKMLQIVYNYSVGPHDYPQWVRFHNVHCSQQNMYSVSTYLNLIWTCADSRAISNTSSSSPGLQQINRKQISSISTVICTHVAYK